MMSDLGTDSERMTPALCHSEIILGEDAGIRLEVRNSPFSIFLSRSPSHIFKLKRIVFFPVKVYRYTACEQKSMSRVGHIAM